MVIVEEMRKCKIWLLFLHDTLKPHWVERLWDFGSLFETWVVRADEG